MREYNTLDDFKLENKTVLLRVDFNMPLDRKTLEILDTTRIKKVLPTINELIKNNAKTVILAHQGRQGYWDFTNLQKHAKALEKLISKKVKFVNDIFGKTAKTAINEMKPGDIILLVDGKKVIDGKQAVKQIAKAAPGTKITLEVMRNGNKMNLTATTTQRPVPKE